MTRSVKEWIAKHDDQAIPSRVKLRLFDRAGGCCQICTVKLTAGRWQADHILALVNGGGHRENNLQAVCVACHADKTSLDVAEKSKTASVKAKHLGIKKPTTWRGWRKMNGEVVWNNRR